MDRGNVLMGTFINSDQVPRRMVRNIIEEFACRKVFVFSVEDENERKFLITFNVEEVENQLKIKQFKDNFKNTIQLHRNKDSNTLFTINSLNELIKQQNKGEKNSDFRVNWTDYKNTILLLGKDGNLKVLNTKLYDIIDI